MGRGVNGRKGKRIIMTDENLEQQDVSHWANIEELLNQWYKQSKQTAPIRVAGLSRRRLMERYGEFGLTKGAEIGVDRGRFSEYMFGVIPGLELICVDPWRPKQRGDSRYKSTLTRMEGKNAKIMRMTSLMASLEIPDKSLDFVYIDGDHTFDYVMMDIILWAKKVRYGGIVSGHDYYNFRRAGVIKAVDTYTYEHGITQMFITDYMADRTPSWFWVRKESFVDPLGDEAK